MSQVHYLALVHLIFLKYLFYVHLSLFALPSYHTTNQRLEVKTAPPCGQFRKPYATAEPVHCSAY